MAAFQWVRETFGRLDVLVNNAGILKATFVLGIVGVILVLIAFFFVVFVSHVKFYSHLGADVKDYKEVFDVNVIAACICIREGVKLITETGGIGHIIIINRLVF